MNMQSIADACSSGDHRLALEAMRDKLARDMDEAPPAVVAQVAGRLQAVLAELASLRDGAEVSWLDELAERREDRGAASDESEPARRQTRQRRKSG